MPWSPNSRKTGSCALGRQRMPGDDLTGELDAFLAEHSGELIEFRRDLHAHPEIGYHEHRTTRRVALRLAAGGLRPMFLPKGTGLIADVGSGVIGPVVSGAAGAGLDGAALFGAGAGAAAAGPGGGAARGPGRAAHPGREVRALPVDRAERLPRV